MSIFHIPISKSILEIQEILKSILFRNSKVKTIQCLVETFVFKTIYMLPLDNNVDELLKGR